MVELLALYGEDRIGSFLPGIKRFAKKAAKYTPQYYIYKGGKKLLKRKKKTVLKIHGDAERIGAFLPGLRKVGKFTSKFTSGIAQAVGVPKVLLDVGAKFDPTRKKKTSIQSNIKSGLAVVQEAQKTVVPVQKEALKIDTKKVLIIGGSAVGALVLLKLFLGSPKQAR